MDSRLLFPLVIALVALAYAGVLVLWVLRQSAGTPAMQAIARAVKDGANAFLRREYTIIAPIAVVLAIIMAVALGDRGGYIAVGFVLGAVLSALSGWIGMAITVRSSARAAEAARGGMGPCLEVSFRAGAVMGMAVAGLGLLGISVLYAWAKDPLLVIGIGFGASLIAMFIRVAGGVFTKAADVGADLVGKVEAGIPEDDPRNPAVIADNVGDNVGDCAGMGADVFESYVVISMAAMLLAFFAFKDALVGLQDKAILYPLFLGGAGIIGSIVGTLVVNRRFKADPMRLLDYAFYTAAVVTAVISFFLARWAFGDKPALVWAVWGSSVLGFAVVVALVRITDYYTSYKFPPVRSIADASQSGPPNNFLAGLSVGLKSTYLPMLTLAAAIIISYLAGYFASDRNALVGIYTTAITTMGMMGLAGIVMSIDAFGPVSDNANGIVEMVGLGEVREVTDQLDAIGNTTKATTKGFAIGTAALSALALFQAFRAEIPDVAARYGIAGFEKPLAFSLAEPAVIIGLLLGGLLPFLFSSFLIAGVGRTAMRMVEEVRRQFKEIPGIMEGTGKPDHARCVDIATRGALRAFAWPAIIAVLSPVVVGIVFGPVAVGGLLIGCLVSGVFMAYFMCNGGGALDNAKKYIEAGHYGGKKSAPHAAAVMGDTVGDPLKDTAGPAMNPLIKVLNTISIIFVPAMLYTGFLFKYL